MGSKWSVEFHRDAPYFHEDYWLRRLRSSRQTRLFSSRKNCRTAADKQGCARLRSRQETRLCSSQQTRLCSSRQKGLRSRQTGLRSSRQARFRGSQQPRLRSSQQETKVCESARSCEFLLFVLILLELRWKCAGVGVGAPSWLVVFIMVLPRRDRARQPITPMCVGNSS